MGGTFRDPSGSLFDTHGRILRLIRPEATARFEALLAHDAVRKLIERGDMVGTRRIAESAVPDALRKLEGAWFEHDRIGFVSLPSEWSVAMLAQAALLTLDINEEFIRNGLILKDATPSNILFDGTKAVFVDVPSVEPVVAGLDLWLARHQFETTFLLPLIASLEAGLPLRWSLADPATGLDHGQLAKMLGLRRWLSFGRIRNIALPAALSRMQSGTVGAPGAAASARARTAGTMDRTQYVLGRSMAGLRRAVSRVCESIRARQSIWSNYATTRGHYTESDLERKRKFVRAVLDAVRPAWVLDIGANTGEFSEMAASWANVVAIDLDEISVSAIHGRARASQLSIQPLVVNLGQPTPATGWRNDERKSFLDRSRGRFDLALMLAVGHHLRVSAGVPLAQIIDMGFELGQGSLLFEFVPATDPMFRAIARGREANYEDNTPEHCEALLTRHARIEMRDQLSNGRILYWAKGGEYRPAGHA